MKVDVDVMYSCHQCGLKKVKVAVPAREAEQDVIFWLQQVAMPRVVTSHHSESPGCASEVCDLLIPITGTDRVGGAPVN